MTVDKVQTLIIDTTTRSSTMNDNQVMLELVRADVVCLTYAIDSVDGLDRLSSYWLPFIRLHGNKNKVPVILVGNKIDVRTNDVSTSPTSSSESNLDRYIVPLMGQFKEIETCIECSAKDLINVAEVFFFASKAVLHPTTPLYDVTEQRLKPLAKQALARIFQLSDKNKDGVMDDNELNLFQRKVFGSPLQIQELEGVKDVVRESFPEGIRNNGLTQDGFFFLHSLFIQRGRLETIWSVLRKYGYDNSVQLPDEYLVPQMSMMPDSKTELSPHGYQFFADLFQTYDRDKDGALNEQELAHLFATAPINPWSDQHQLASCVKDEAGAMTLQGFLALWSMTTLIDYKKTLAYLAYLGFEGDTKSAIKTVRIKKTDTRKVKNVRSVFQAYVIGATGCGKTEFMKASVGKNFDPKYQSTTSAGFLAVNSVEMGGAEKYLVMKEITPEEAPSVLKDHQQLEKCDVMCFVYDTSDPNSFSYLESLYQRFNLESCPIVFVGTKNDLPRVVQQSSLQPEQLCSQLKLSSPLAVSRVEDTRKDVYNILIGVAMNPYVAMPAELSSDDNKKFIWRIVWGSVSVSILGMGVYVGWRVHNARALAQLAPK